MLLLFGAWAAFMLWGVAGGFDSMFSGPWRDTPGSHPPGSQLPPSASPDLSPSFPLPQQGFSLSAVVTNFHVGQVYAALVAVNPSDSVTFTQALQANPSIQLLEIDTVAPTPPAEITWLVPGNWPLASVGFVWRGGEGASSFDLITASGLNSAIWIAIIPATNPFGG